jgi:hypothetical protein
MSKSYLKNMALGALIGANITALPGVPVWITPPLFLGVAILIFVFAPQERGKAKTAETPDDDPRNGG